MQSPNSTHRRSGQDAAYLIRRYEQRIAGLQRFCVATMVFGVLVGFTLAILCGLAPLTFTGA